MERIKLLNSELLQAFATTSKGNQIKWFKNNRWYKADCMGYEGLSEVTVSRLLIKSDIDEFVSYSPVLIETENAVLNGCCSENFKREGQSIVTLEKLSRMYTGRSISEEMAKYSDAKERIVRVVDFLQSVTKIQSIGKYIGQLIAVDAFFLNEDRHTNNIAFFRDEITGEYSLCPFFDFGLSMLADTLSDYPINADYLKLMKKVRAKPFDTDFDVQLDIFEQLYGCSVHFDFSEKDVDDALIDLKDIYSELEINRVKEILFQQKRKYSYLFK